MRLRVSASDGSARRVGVEIIRGGEVLRTHAGQTPVGVAFTDSSPWAGKTFYRVAASGEADSCLLSNPVFVDKGP